MPRIPKFQQTTSIPGSTGGVAMSPQLASAPERALIGLGQSVSQAGQEFDKIAEKEALAHDTIEATKLEYALKNKGLEIAESYNGRSDYNKFEDDLNKQLSELQTLLPKNASKRLQAVFQKAYEQEAFHLNSAIKTKKWNIMDEQGRIAFGNIYNQALDDYSKAQTPEEKEIIKNELMMKGETLKIYNAVNPVWMEGQLSSFDGKAKQFAIDAADVYADKAIEDNPAQAELDLADSNYLPDLPVKIRQDKIEKARAAAKVQQNEFETKRKEADKLVHDEYEKAIGLEYSQGNYAKAFTMVGAKNSPLAGDEVKAWTDSIKEKAINGDDLSTNTVASEIVKINSMIARDESPDKIRSYILRTPKLKKEDKEQYLNKVETKISQEMSEGRSRAYRDIEDIIIPKRGAFANVLKTESETRAVMKAQMALDDWIDTQKKADKNPSVADIRVKAQSLAEQMQVPIATKISEIEGEAKKRAAESKEISEIKVKVNKIPKPDREKIESSLKAQGQEVTNANILKVYELNSKAQ
ncbi:MAG: hypothetical protein WC836_13195 [Desulfobacula sp.]|jgi:hypothetical protein